MNNIETLPPVGQTYRELLDRAAVLQSAARDTIEHLGLERLWSTVGRPVLVGATRFGLMRKPNLDFEIYVDAPTVEAGFGVISRLASIPGVTEVRFLNFMGIESDPGLYWQVFYRAPEGTMWDVDNWLVPFSHPHAGMADAFATAMQATLSDQTRAVIMRIKTTMPPDCGARGIDVYRAVLDYGVRTLPEFMSWLDEAGPRDGIETWIPGKR